MWRNKSAIACMFLLADLASATSPPPGSIQVFFDEHMQTNWQYNGSGFGAFWVIAYDLPPETERIRFRLEWPDVAGVFVSAMPGSGFTNMSSGRDFELTTTQTCPQWSGKTILASGVIFPLTASAVDFPICLESLTDIGDSTGIGVLRCGGDWEALVPFYEGCAIFNPMSLDPPPLPPVDLNHLRFSLQGAGAGEPLTQALIGVYIDAELHKAGNASQLGELEYILRWNPAVASYESHQPRNLPTGWSSNAESLTPGELRVRLSGSAPLNAFGQVVTAIYFMRGSVRSQTPLVMEVLNATDTSGAPVDVTAAPDHSLSVTCNEGDILGNGRIDAMDALLSLEFAAFARIPEGPAQFCRADMNQNDELDAGDAVLVLRKAVGMPPPANVSKRPENAYRLRLGEGAGLSFRLRLASGQSLVHLSGDVGLAAVYSVGDREIRVAAAGALAGELTLWLAVEGPDGSIHLGNVARFGEDGLELEDATDRDLRLVAGRLVERLPRPRVQILSIRPNPANPAASIEFELGSPARTTLEIYDSRGRRVFQDSYALLSAGDHRVEWNGEDSNGHPVASGTYHVLVRSRGQVARGDLVLVR